MAGLGQIAFLGGGGLSGLIAALITMTLDLATSFALLGLAGLVVGLLELAKRHDLRLEHR
jgi:xanthosine utilization system XapX-like protein